MHESVRSVLGAAIFSVSALLFQPAQASHLFTQGGDGDNPVFLSAGQSINLTIDQNSVFSFGASPQAYLETSFSGDWNAGDSIRINAPSGASFDVAFGQAPLAHNPGIFSGTVSPPAGIPTATLSAFFNDAVLGNTWRLDALTGGFTVAGVVFNLLDGSNIRQVIGSRVDVSAAFATPAQAPEPASLALLGAGIAGIGLTRRRRHRRRRVE